MSTTQKVAIIDDEADLRDSVALYLKLSDFVPVTFETADAALRFLTPEFDGVIISDIRMPGTDGMALLRRLQSIDPGLPVILMTGHGDVPMAVEAMRIGAFDFIEKPFEPDQLTELCQKASEARGKVMETRALRRELSDGSVLMRRLMGDSPAIRRLRETILDAAQADGHVLVRGETGTGKSLVARALHACGPKASKLMVTVNCASMSPEKLEAALFGDPDSGEKPLVEQAEGSTLCLEAVEALPPSAQVRLLDLLSAGEVDDAVGTGTSSFRIISVSGTLAPGQTQPYPFREDLYYRLNSLTVETPPLRTRGEDILALFAHFMVEFADEYGCDAPAINAADAANLVQAPWPGNIRQLINLAERAILQTRRGDLNISALLIDDGFQVPSIPLDSEKPLKEHVDAFERMLIDHSLRRNGGSVVNVMNELALPRRTLNEKMAKYGLSRQDYLATQQS